MDEVAAPEEPRQEAGKCEVRKMAWEIARKKGRSQEMNTFAKMNVYHYSSMQAYKDTPGAVLIDTT